MTETPGAYANPTCLRSGEWEPAQRCEPIWCPAYRPPVHGAVFPTGRVRAGDRVEVSCLEGYKRVWASPTAREDPACLDARVFEEGVTCAPLECPPYEPPAHGSVRPTAGVRAGARVHISCDEGYEPVTVDRAAYGTDSKFGEV
jgi:hypothetical protein